MGFDYSCKKLLKKIEDILVCRADGKVLCKVDADSLLHGGRGDLQHPGGGIEALLAAWNPRDGLKVPDQRTGLLAQVTVICHLATDFHEQQVIECLRRKEQVKRDPKFMIIGLKQCE